MDLRALTVGAVAVALLAPAGALAKPRIYPSLGNSGYQATHYDLDLTWYAAAGDIDATATITAKARSTLTSYTFDLAGLTVAGVTSNGVPAVVSRAGRKLRVTPQTPIAKGATFTTVVTYSGVPRHLVDKDGSKGGWLRTGSGAVTLSEPRGAMTWFPNNNVPSDKATYDVSVNVPEGYQAVSNGRNVSVTPVGVRSVWRWVTSDPMASYLSLVAIGKYTRHTRTVDGIVFDSFVAKGQHPNGKALRTLPRVVRRLASWFGPYPFRDAGLLVDNVGVFYALETQNRPFFPGYAGELTLVHELAHQWYGDSVTPRSWQHIWLNEGLATYAEWLWRARRGGPSVHKQLRQEYFSTVRWKPAPLRVTARTLFDDAVYTRGAMTLQALRERIGTKAFFKVLRTWARKHKGRTVTTAEFKRLAEHVSHRQLDKLFHDWLVAGKRPRGYVR